MNFWAMVNNVVLRAIGRGQLPLLGVISIIILILWRMPSEDLSQLIRDIFTVAIAKYLLGYIIAIVAIIYWNRSSKKMRRAHAAEISRLADEKTKLQNLLLDKRVESSERNRR